MHELLRHYHFLTPDNSMQYCKFINVCFFETKPCLRGFAVSLGLVVWVHELCLRGTYFCDLKMVAEFAK